MISLLIKHVRSKAETVLVVTRYKKQDVKQCAPERKNQWARLEFKTAVRIPSMQAEGFEIRG